MRIVWDEPKRQANIARHGFDFAELDEAFFERSVIAPAKLGRMIAIGRHRSGVVVVVFLVLGAEGIQRHQHAAGEPQGTEIDRWLSSKNHSSRAAVTPGKIGTPLKARN